MLMRHWSRIALNLVGLVEYYFETARTMADLTLQGSFVNLTNIRWQFAHCGGSFSSIEDRFLKQQTPAVELAAKQAYKSRCVVSIGEQC